MNKKNAMRVKIMLFWGMVILSLFTSTGVFASDFEVDGICYNILPNTSYEVEVTSKLDKKYGTNIYSGDIIIPSEVKYLGIVYKVTAIGDNSFYGCGHYINSITLPSSIITIGDGAFTSLWDIKTFTIPSSVITIGNRAFTDCQSLESIDVPENVTSIGDEAFDYCLNLKSVTLGNSLKTISNSAFSRCGKLTSLNIPNSVEKIGQGAFADCKYLKTVTLSQNLSEIGRSAFYQCESLSSIIIPKSVKSIGEYAFYNCYAADTIISRIEDPFEIPTYVFRSLGYSSQPIKHSVLLVPYGSKSKYQQYIGWYSCFTKIEEELPNFSFTIISSGNGSVLYDGNKIRNDNYTFYVNVEETISITITPDDGYQIKSVTVNGIDVISQVSNNSYTIRSISTNTKVEVEFEELSSSSSTMTITASGNGQVQFGQIVIRNGTNTFIVTEGETEELLIKSDNGFRVKSILVNNQEYSSGQSNIRLHVKLGKITNINVVFEAIPPTTYTLSITASGNGSASYGGTTIRSKTSSFTVNAGSSATITFSPDNGYRIKSVTFNGTDVTPYVSDNQYTISSINSNTTVEVEFEAIPVTTYTLSITSSDNGSVLYNGTTVRNSTRTFTLNEGTSATITFSPDNGYRIKSVSVNGTDVTPYVLGNQYTISSINSNMAVVVDFETIPVTTYTLSITSSGNGSVSYNGTTARNSTRTFTLNEGTSAIITFSPDNGYQIKSATMNGRDISDLSTMSFTIDFMDEDVSIEVEFEVIPVNLYTLMYVVDDELYKSYQVEEGTKITPEPEPTKEGYTFSGWSEIPTIMPAHDVTVTGSFTKNEPDTKTYVLSITATGNGSVSYNKTTTRNSTKTFTLNEGVSAIITFNPDEGYRIKRATMNGREIADLSSMSFTIDVMDEDVSIEVEFEAIPISTYTLTIKSIGSGFASYYGTIVRDNIQTFELNEGTSAVIIFSPDDGYQIKSVKVNNTDVTSQVSNNQYTLSKINTDTIVEVVFEIESWPTDDKFTENGIKYHITGLVQVEVIGIEAETSDINIPNSVSYNGKSYLVLRIDNNAFFQNNTLVSITLPNTLKSIGISAFEGCSRMSQITLPGSINSIGLTAFKNCTNLKRVISEIESPNDIDNSVFEGIAFGAILQIPEGSKYRYLQHPNWTSHFASIEGDGTMYRVIIEVSGRGEVKNQNTTISNGSVTFIKDAGVSMTLSFYPSSGYRIKQVMVNDKDVSTQIDNDIYVISNINKETIVKVEFEAIIVHSYTLKYVVDGETYKTYQVEEGTTITPEPAPTKEGYTFSGWSEIPETMPDHDVTITGTFTKNKPDINSLDKEFTIDGINYEMVSTDNLTVVVAEGDYGKILEVPANIMFGEYDWDVIGLKDDALDKCEELAAIIWNPSAMFNVRVKNPNLLLYVHDQNNASYGVNNVIVNGTAESIELTDATNSNDFYCPRAFTAKKISYSHSYNMETGLGESKGWETIVLPFDVQNYTHATKGEIEPFTTWTMGSNKKPFWLFELTADGYKDVPGIKANTPYIISMPNNRQYEQQYLIPGVVTFSATNVEVKESDDMKSVIYQNRIFIPNYTNQKNLDYLPLNVNNNYVTYEGADAGSKFIGGLRSVHPFEAYMTTKDGTRSIDIMDGMTTAIRDICMKADNDETMKVYDIKGVLVKTVTTNDELRSGLPAGIYIVNGKKMIIK